MPFGLSAEPGQITLLVYLREIAAAMADPAVEKIPSRNRRASGFEKKWTGEWLKVSNKYKLSGPRLNEGPCIRLRQERGIMCGDFVETQTYNGRTLELMTLIDSLPVNAGLSA